MRSYHLEVPGSFDGVILRENPTPAPRPHEIILRVHAASLNRRDLMIVAQTYPIPGRPGVVPLSDGAGEVVAVGADVTRFKVGDRVTGNYFARWRDGRLAPDMRDQLGCTLDGMASEYAVLDEQWAVRLPDHLSWEEGACLSCAGVTAWCSVTGSEFARPGNTVLALGTGDVSLFTVRFAKLMGCRVIATTSSETKARQLREIGADEVINYAVTPEWGAVVRERTNGEGANLIVETMGPPTMEQSLIAAARYSEIVVLIWKNATQPNIVLPASAYGPSLAVLRKRFVGSRADLEAMTRAMAEHELRPVIDRIFDFEALDAAYRYFSTRSGFGKVVIRMG